MYMFVPVATLGAPTNMLASARGRGAVQCSAVQFLCLYFLQPTVVPDQNLVPALPLINR